MPGGSSSAWRWPRSGTAAASAWLSLRAVSRLLQGRLDKVAFATVRDKDGRVSIRVTAALIDPLSRIKSAEFDYLPAQSVADKPKPADPLDALDGCHKLKLTIQDGKATGSIPLKKGISEVRLLHQAVSIYGDGKRVRSSNLTETVKVAMLPRRRLPAKHRKRRSPA